MTKTQAEIIAKDFVSNYTLGEYNKASIIIIGENIWNEIKVEVAELERKFYETPTPEGADVDECLDFDEELFEIAMRELTK